MQIYLVGGAVRDKLLGLTVTERDWVVVGATPQEMIKLGFQPVGKEFPVFLHPKTHEEYALARTERKIAKGYKGFHFYTSTEVTLEQDLLRRDLTINAMAMDDKENLIDPYHGLKDLKNKILHHVSVAFAEDPVRILRIARFNARFPKFTIHPDTLTLMQTMVRNGEVDALVPERVWAELSRALTYDHFEKFFEVLDTCGALPLLFPEINLSALKKLSEKPQTSTLPAVVRFACLLTHLNATQIKHLATRLRLPHEFSELALLVNQQVKTYATLDMQDTNAILTFLKKVDALRRPERFHAFLTAALHCYPTQDDRHQVLLACLTILKKINTKSLQQQGLKGQDFALALDKLRINALTDFLHSSRK